MYDHVLVKEIKLNGLRKFAEYLHSGENFSIYMAVGNELRLVKDENVINEACDALGAVREIHMFVVDRSEGDENL